jgi:capsular polysaccharide transport system permease protein
MFNPVPIPSHSKWKTQILVIQALLKREIATRFGKYRLGFLWMLFEPVLGVLVLGLIIGPIAQRSVPEIPYVFFLLNGFLLLQLFTNAMNMSVDAINANQGLLVYPSVQIIDPLLARFIFGLITTMFSFALFCVISMWLGVSMSLDNLHIILTAYLITWVCGCGFGLIFGIAAVQYRETEKVIKVIQRPLLFVSAVLHPINVMPTEAREWILYNPLVHTIELSRNALFPFYRVEGANLLYPSIFAIVVFAIGITYFRNHRHLLSEL